MVDENLIRSLQVSDEEVDKHLNDALGTESSSEALEEAVKTSSQHKPGTIMTGRVVAIFGNEVVVDVGLKSEGVVYLDEFKDPDSLSPGDEVEVFLEEVESEDGIVVLSKRKADRIRGWEWILANKGEGDTVTGVISRKIKGGLLVDIGVPAFLPASQVDVRRPGDVGQYVGQEIEARILKIDKQRHNIVISRRKLIEDIQADAKEKLLEEIEKGQLRKGTVKNIADFGAFIDLGGLDGLLHITDMSWGRVGHPSEMLSEGQEVEVMILSVDREEDKVALGLKQKTPNPWENIHNKYPPGTKVTGEVVNIMPYGAFVKIEEGLEGLVHISEMSWTKRINHPSEVVQLGDRVEVMVLDIDDEKQEISLGMKQAEENPWMLVKEKYPPGTVITGVVRGLTNFGAFVEIEEGIEGMLHVSDMSWTRKITHPGEVVKKGQEIKCVVLVVDEQKMRVSLGLKQLTEDPWLREIPEQYIPGQIIKGKVTKLTSFGAFVELEEGLEGLLHISEMADHRVDSPKEVLEVGQEIEVKVLRVDSEDRRIRLSLKRAQWAAEEEAAGAEAEAEPVKRRGGLDAETGPVLDERYIQATQEEAVEQQQPQAPPGEVQKPEEKQAKGGEEQKVEESDTPDKDEKQASDESSRQQEADEAQKESAPPEEHRQEQAKQDKSEPQQKDASESPGDEQSSKEEQSPQEEKSSREDSAKKDTGQKEGQPD